MLCHRRNFERGAQREGLQDEEYVQIKQKALKTLRRGIELQSDKGNIQTESEDDLMYSIGRICIKTAGRDAGREAVVVDVLDERMVLVDGNVRRKKCNIMHLEPTQKTVEIEKNSSHEKVADAFKKLGFNVWETKPKQPQPQKAAKTEQEEPKKKAKKPAAKKAKK